MMQILVISIENQNGLSVLVGESGELAVAGQRFGELCDIWGCGDESGEDLGVEEAGAVWAGVD